MTPEPVTDRYHANLLALSCCICGRVAPFKSEFRIGLNVCVYHAKEEAIAV